MIYSHNKSQQDALFLNFYFDKELHMFRTDLLSIIRSLNIVFTETGICHTGYVDCLLARSGWSLIADSQHNCMTNTSCCEYIIKTPYDGE